jgi:FAD/FMN-containing dehydrogenase
MAIDVALSAIRQLIGDQHVVAGDDTAGFVVDWTGRYVGSTPAVVRPGTTSEVAGVIHICREHAIAVVPQGGNTGMVGGSVPLNGEIVLSLQRLTSIGEVDELALQVTAEAGVTIEQLQTAAAASGLRYGVDFGGRGSATVGGTIATNAGGLNVLRHGMTRSQLIGIEVVLGTGEVIDLMSGLVKNNTGYSIPDMMCGSEGTLGVITKARLRLIPQQAFRHTALLAFDTIEAAVEATARLRIALPGLEAAELMLSQGVQLVCDEFELSPPLDLGFPVFLLVESASDDDALDDFVQHVSELAGVVDTALAADERQRQLLWRLRDDHTTAINRVGVPHKFDVTLPHDRLAEFTKAVQHHIAGSAPEASTWMFGHVGDGNLHVNITGLTEDDFLDRSIYELVISMNGSISAEHGVGTAKAKYLPLQRSTAELQLMRGLKSVCDPDGILNPAVIFS